MSKFKEYLFEQKPYKKNATLNIKEKDYEDAFDKTMEFIEELSEDNFPIFGNDKENIPDNQFKITINISQLDKENTNEFLNEFESWSNSKKETWYKTELEGQDLWIEPIKADFKNGKLNVTFAWDFGNFNRKRTNLKIRK